MREKLLEKIINSKEFCNSSIYGHYLTYLFESSLQGKSLKEATIAIDVFGKSSDFNPAEDTTVRTHTYTLREKLERYYFTEGKDDKYRIRIPKGHYELSIVEVSENFYHPKILWRFLSQNYHWAIIGILGAIILYLLIFNHSIKKDLEAYRFIDQDDMIWKEYIQSDLPILIVPGDHFFFNAYDEKLKREVGIRDMCINSPEDLQELQTKFPEGTFHPWDEPYFPYHSIWAMPPILSVLFSANKKPILRKSSVITPQMLGEYNIIFIGSIKTLYALKHTLTASHFSFEISPHIVTYTPPDSSSVENFTTNLHSTGPNEDLVLTLKLPGPANNSILIIASYHSLGAPEIANYLVNSDTRTELEELFQKKYGHTPRHFEILFRVIGIDKTAYRKEILVMNEI